MRVLSSEMFSSLPNQLHTEEPQALPLLKRLRRNRKSPAVRALLQETRLHPSDFVAPLFVQEGVKQQTAIASLPGVSRLSIDLVLKEVEQLVAAGIQAIDLFAVVPQEKKDAKGSEALREENLICRAVQAVKREFPQLCVMADVALDPYTDHGHDGLIDTEGRVINDESVRVLGKMSLLLAEAGVDVIAPSDMMDGRVAYIRALLDREHFTDVSILSYTAKYASAFYGPFREALSSAPKSGDKLGYQLSPPNRREALLEAALDEAEGADMLLVKPALAYLDILAAVKERTLLPVGGYHVSGEYAMVKAAGERGWIDADRAMIECLMAIKRAGADFIFTYAAKEVATVLNR